MVKTKGRADQLEAALRGAIPEGWQWEYIPLPSPALRAIGVHAQVATTLRPDGELKLRDPVARPVTLQVQLKEHVPPSEVARLLPLYSDSRWLIVSRVIGPRAREVLNGAGISWLQLDGDCRISVDSLFIERTRQGRPTSRRGPRPARRYVADLFSGAALRVVRWLLIDPSRSWSLSEMQRRANASGGFVSRTFATLERDAYVAREAAGITLRDRQGLLRAWSDARPPVETTVGLISLLATSQRILSALSELNSPGQYALTAEGAADQVAPFARFTRVELYVTEIEPWTHALDLRKVERGANVVLIQPVDLGVFDGARVVNGLRIVSWPQLYVDLKRRGGAAAEAADHLMAQEGR